MRLTLACIFAFGCNQVYGLDETDIDDPDDDDDGTIDEIDNCPAIANDQANRDGDEFGDACDACPLGANVHDEDIDGVPDGCDVCPAVADDQANTDGDDLGDACDLATGLHTRVLFESFEQLTDRWVPLTNQWVAEADAVHQLDPIDVNSGSFPGLFSGADRLQGAQWSISVDIEIDLAGLHPDTQSPQIEIGFKLFGPDLRETAVCFIRRGANNTWMVKGPNFSPAPTFPIASTVRLHMWARGPFNPMTSQQPIACQANDTMFVDNLLVSAPFSMSLFALTSKARFRAVDKAH